MTPTIGSLCTGYGGLDMAVQAVLGGRLAWVADPDLGAAALLAHHHPNVPNLGDITVTDWAQVPQVDIVCAGFPCQDISYAGRGEGIREGNRSGLWHVIADALAVLRPGLVVLENVAAIVGRRPGLDIVLADLAELGFDAEWTCVRASDVGAAHRRKRWFLAAQDPNRAACGEWRIATSGQEESGRARTDTGGRGGAPAPDSDHFGVDGDRPTGRPEERHPQGSGGSSADAQGPRRERPGSEPEGRGPERGGRAAADTEGDGRYERWAEPAGQQGRPNAALGCGAATDTHCDPVRERPVAESRSGGEAIAELADVDWNQFRPAIERWTGVLGRPAPDPTEPAPRGGRRLSPCFVEWVMGLPEGWITGVPGITRNQMLKLGGNGVVPQQGAAALRLLLDRFEELMSA